MKKEQKKRRSFLKHILAGSAVVAGAAAIVKPAKAESGLPRGPQSDEVLYHESENFKKYYKSLRS
ncbi:MAG: twin-arginine translocation signal domain-containing protein [Desulfobulbaceae bacterium]|nr:MAG: twin-arginine translocation signal domain-containing protein [Desulfobulbaceae bacterium]